MVDIVAGRTASTKTELQAVVKLDPENSKEPKLKPKTGESPMGLDTSHGCWHGAYTAFSRWRDELARVAGMPPLWMMEGYFDPNSLCGTMITLKHASPKHWEILCKDLPISWDCLKRDVLYVLLHHSDCDGIIESYLCAPLADRLEELMPLLPSEPDPGHIGIWQEKTQTFIDGLREAARLGENVEFH